MNYYALQLKCYHNKIYYGINMLSRVSCLTKFQSDERAVMREVFLYVPHLISFHHRMEYKEIRSGGF